jgi:hypothetical protein
MPAWMLEAEASKQKLGRQVFWLTAPDDPRRPSHAGNPTQWPMSFKGLADYSGGPATDLHRFPYCPPNLVRRGGTRRVRRLLI